MGSRQLICASDVLVDGGPGVRFEVEDHGEPAPALAVRYRGSVRAYLNRCSHIGVELDMMPGHFFDRSGSYLICATHGATYDPGTGSCAGGPCNGIGLEPLAVIEAGGHVELVGRVLVYSPEGQGIAGSGD